MNTSFPPQKYPQNTSPPISGGGLSGEPGAVPGHFPPLPDSNAVIQMKQHFLHL